MNRKVFWKIGLLCLGLVALTGIAFGFSLIFSYQGTVKAYDFGGFGPGHDTAGTVEIQAFTLDPGENVPWHYHKGLSYIVLVQGNLTEQELTRDGTCGAPQTLRRGAAFVETPGRWHTVTNTSNNKAVLFWSTIYPKDDPDGDTVFVNPPNCN